MPMDCVSVDIFCVQLENNYFDNKYYWNWSDAAAELNNDKCVSILELFFSFFV